MNKKFLIFIVLFAAFFAVSTAFAITASERAELIRQIAGQLAVLRQQMALLQGSDAGCHAFTINLQFGDRGANVSALQSVLIKGKFLDLLTPTGYYGTKTFYAVAAFQYKYASEILTPNGLSKPTGKVGPATRDKLNSLYSCNEGEVETNIDVVEEELAYKEPVEEFVEPVVGEEFVVEEQAEEFIVEEKAEEIIEEIIEEPVIACVPKWTCVWGSCVNGYKSQTTVDANNCGQPPGKNDMCSSALVACATTLTGCAPNWTCGWGECKNGWQSYVPVDSNNCGQPATSANIACIAQVRACAACGTAKDCYDIYKN